MDTLSIRVPYKNLKHNVEEVEMIKYEEEANQRIESDKSINGNTSSPLQSLPSSEVKNCSLITLILSCTVAAGVQFGWALQLSLLTPYIQVFFFFFFFFIFTRIFDFYDENDCNNFIIRFL